MSASKHFTKKQAQEIGAALGIDWDEIAFDEFRDGIEVELEHGSRDPATDVTHNDAVLTGKIALAHLKEFPDYYTRLGRLEEQATRFWSKRRAAHAK